MNRPDSTLRFMDDSWDSWLLSAYPLHKAYLLPLCFFSFTHIPIYSPTLDPVLLQTQRSLPAHSGFLAQSPTPNTNPPPPALLDQAWEVGIAAVEARAAG